MYASLRAGLVLLLVTLWAVGPSSAQGALTQQDRQGPVTVAVTLLVPAPGAPIKAKVVLDTHSVSLDGIAFEQAVVLRPADGTELAVVSVEQASGSGHHREAVLVFPALAELENVRLVVKNVGGIAERSFSWKLPAR